MPRANSIVPPDDTIYALSSGALPAAIAVVRISGRGAGPVLRAMAGDPPPPRQASLRKLIDAQGELLDRALVLWIPGPNTATGDDLVELHLHGGRAVVGAVMRTLDEAGLRLAEPGEFTRRALFNGRMDVSAVEGLADLLAAETETQRKEALLRSEGVLGRKLADWSAQLIAVAARVEADIDYDGEDNTGAAAIAADVDRLRQEIESAVAAPSVERLRDGIRVAIVGPPNAGKSTLFNALVGGDAAIVSPLAGTTRDAIERPVSLGGLPFLFVDTAGLRETDEPVEQIGVERARKERERADLVVDLAGLSMLGVIGVSAKTDIAENIRPETIAISAVTGTGLNALRGRLLEAASSLLPRVGEVALSRRYREGLGEIAAALSKASEQQDIVIIAEDLRAAMTAMDRLTGTAGLEDMLDALFGRFCLGK